METKNLHFAYGDKPVLNDITLDFPKGRFISILGPNGSGKSTLLKLLLGFLTPDKGEVLIQGKQVQTLSPLQKAREVSYVPQTFQSDYDFTALQIVQMARYPFIKRWGDLTEEDQRICREAMDITETWELRDERASEISGGELQRVSVARAIAQTSPWILLDEPVNHLDISHQIGILKSLRSMTPKRTIIAVMHDLNLARDFSDQVILLHQGRVVKTGRPGECINPEVLSSIYDLEFLKTWTEDRSLQYLFPKIK